jgi:hypothetical protein
MGKSTGKGIDAESPGKDGSMSYEMPRTDWLAFSSQLGQHLSRAAEATGQAIDYTKALKDFNTFKISMAKEVSDMMGTNYNDKQKQSVANKIMMSKDPDEIISKVAEFKMQGDLFAKNKEELTQQGVENPNLPLPQFGIKSDTYDKTFLQPWAKKATAQAFQTQNSAIDTEDASIAALRQRHPNAPEPVPGSGAGPLTPEETQAQMVPFAGTDQKNNIDQMVAERRNTQNTQSQMAQPVTDTTSRADFIRTAAAATGGEALTPTSTQMANALPTDLDYAKLQAARDREATRRAYEQARLRLAKWHESKTKQQGEYTIAQINDDVLAYSKEQNALDDDINKIHNHLADLNNRLTFMKDDPATKQAIESQQAQLDMKKTDKTSIMQNLKYLQTLQSRHSPYNAPPATAPAAASSAAPGAQPRFRILSVK